MKLCLSSILYGEKGFAGILPLCREEGFEAVEIYGAFPPYASIEPGYLKQFAGVVFGNGMEISTYHLSYRKDITSTERSVRSGALDALRSGAEEALVLGAKVVIVHPGRACAPADRELRTALCAESLHEFCRYCAGVGLRVAVENMLPGHTVSGVSELLDFIEKLPRETGICLDTGHALVSEGPDVQDTVRRVASRLISLHVHDNDGRDDLHRVPGQGIGRWDGFIPALVSAGYDGAFTLELEPHEDLEEMIKAGGQWYRNATKYSGKEI